MSKKINSKKFYLLILSLIFSSFLCAQGSFDGSIVDSDNYPISYAQVCIKSSQVCSYSDGDGNFKIEAKKNDTLIIKFAGYITLVSRIGDSKVFTLEDEVLELDEVVIDNKSESELKSEEPITTTVLDAKEVRAQAITTTSFLRRSTGVLVREQGGLGSKTTINLNGLTGNAVKTYYDGIPIELLGGLSLNNISINAIDRLEVYKGVMPISVGTDALGGGINIVPLKIDFDFFESSYEIGSFNTHKLSVLGAKVLKKGFYVTGSVNYNHSDNDYLMKDVPNQSEEIIENIFGGIDTIPVENVVDATRFHNKHDSFFGSVEIGVNDKKYADELSFRSSYSYIYDEIQHGQTVSKKAVGEADELLHGFAQILKYKKEVGGKFSVSYLGTFSNSFGRATDYTDKFYDWDGNQLSIVNNSGAEIGSPTDRTGVGISTSHRALLAYDLHKNHTATLSNLYTYTRIWGEDPFNTIPVNGELIDPNTIPATFDKNFLGAEIKSHWLKSKKFTSILFYKNYYYNAESIDITKSSTTDIKIPTRHIDENLNGGGVGLRYKLSKSLLVRTSFERAVRIPTTDEIFGNFLFVLPNFELRPETSNNLNAGFVYSGKRRKNFNYKFDFNFFLRDQQDLIRVEAIGSGDFARYVNEDEVSSLGGELSSVFDFFEKIRMSNNFSYQKIAISATENFHEEAFIGVQIPNSPKFFWNTSLAYKIESPLNKKDEITFSWTYIHVNPFSITDVLDVESANEANIVPAQNQHSTGVTYKIDKYGVSINGQVHNVFNAELFDNFKVPKPGRNFALKIIYSKL